MAANGVLSNREILAEIFGCNEDFIVDRLPLTLMLKDFLKIDDLNNDELQSLLRDIVLSRNLQQQMKSDLSEQLSLERVREYVRELKRLDEKRRRVVRRLYGRAFSVALQRYLTNYKSVYRSRIDRVVIDVFNLETITQFATVQRAIRSVDFSEFLKTRQQREVIPVDVIEFLRSSSDDVIDGVVQEFETFRRKQLEEGWFSNSAGCFVYELHNPTRKCMFYFRQDGPIRLRVITNIQMSVLSDLFTQDPSLFEKYRSCSWLGNSEINYILPEHYSFYERHENEYLEWLHDWAVGEYRVWLEKLNIPYIDSDVQCRMSHAEVCWEEPFYSKDRDYVRYLIKCQQSLLPIVHSYSKIHYERKSSRYGFVADIVSYDPSTPLCVFKIYPKYFSDDGTLMLRREIVVTSSFAKTINHLDLNSVSDDSFSVRFFDSAYASRKYIHAMFDFVRDVYQRKSVKCESCGPKRLSPFAQFLGLSVQDVERILVSGRVVGLQSKTLRKLVDVGFARKIRRGVYEPTELFISLLRT